MKKIFALFLMAFPLYGICANQVTLSISNQGNSQRQEVVEFNLKEVYQQLGLDTNTSIVIKNGFGQQAAYQKTYDGKLLLYVAVQPKGCVNYTVSEGEPSEFKKYVQGRMYPERVDDITWENDLGIYRIYGPALQRTGERSFGTDVWIKNTPEPVAEYRYQLHLKGMVIRDSLKRAGKEKEAYEKDLSVSFHRDQGYGLDCYSVGPSLGCGAPALMKDDKLIFPYCYKEYRILDNGPLRFTVELTYNTNNDGITEHRIITLDKGSHFNRIKVWYDGITQPMAFASGVVLHGTDNLVLGKNYVQYADPTDTPKIHQSQIYVATLFPNGVSETRLLKGALNHGIGMVKQYKGEPYTYYFGSAWSSYDIHTQAQWQLCINEYLSNLSNPLKTQLQ